MPVDYRFIANIRKDFYIALLFQCEKKLYIQKSASAFLYTAMLCIN